MKRKFVKMMFFGALALSAVTYVGCEDYDDDIKGVQEQIDQIESNNLVSSEDLQSAIDAAKSALESQLATLKTNLEDKDSQITILNQKIADLEQKLANAADKAADKATVDQLTTDLTAAKNDLEALKNLHQSDEDKDSQITILNQKIADLEQKLENAAGKATVDQLTTDLIAAKNDLKALTDLHQSDIDGLKTRIERLETLTNELNGLKNSFATKEELSNYVQTANLSGLISGEIIAALEEDGKIAAAINSAIQTKVLAEFGSMKEVAALAGENGTVAKVIQDLYAAINDDKTGILAKLVELEDYSAALGAEVKEGSEKVDGVIAEVASLKTTLSGLYASSDFGDAVKAVVATELETVKSDIATLRKDLEKLGIAINGMIQSVVYIPTTIDRSVDFSTLYAQKTNTKPYEVAAKSAGAKELQFRISPASAAMTLEDFNKNYEIKLNAEERDWTRAAESFAVEVKACNAGILTVSLTTTSEKSHAISLNIASKESGEELTPTNVNSDYIAVIQSNYYLKDAYYTVEVEKDGEIIYNDPAPVDYSGVGTLTVKYTTTEGGSPVLTKPLNELNVTNIFNTTYTLSGANSNLFKIEAGSVSLKEPGLIASLDKTADIQAKVTSEFYITTNTPKKLGTVKVTRIIKDLAHTYAAVEYNWDGTPGSDYEKVLITSDIYNNPSVNIRPSEYETLALYETLPVTGVRFELGPQNALTLIIPKNAPVDDYTAEAKFEGDGYILTVKAPVKIKPITLAKLSKVAEMWSDDGIHTGFTPTRNSQNAATAITSEFRLATVFSNFDAVKSAVLAKGGSFDIATNTGTIAGVDFNESTTKFTFDKDAYTGKMTVGPETVPAVVKFTITVSYNGREEEKIEGIVEVNDISGTWVAPATTSLSLSDKSKDYNVSTGFSWTDLAGKTMWKDGKLVKGDNSNGFASSVVNPLYIYGLEAPTFAFKEAAAATYLSIDAATGVISFTGEGKSHHFYQPVTYTVEVKATSKWGTIKNYEGKNTITITIPAE